MHAPAAQTDLIDRLSTGLRAYVMLAFLALIAALPGLFSAPPLDRDESRFAQATAQMLESGDYVNISVQDEPRHKKPIGIHWLQAASVAATTGVEAREIWAYRLPSVLGVMLTILATFWAGAALVGRRAAFVGASLFAVSLLLSTEGMIAKTDAMMTGFTALALAAMAQLYAGKAQRPRLLALIAWGAVGAGILIKGPITPMVAGLAVAALCLWERRWDWTKPLRHWSGPVLMAAVTLPWLIAIGIETNGAFFAEALVGDLAPKVSAGGEHPFAPPGVHSLLASVLLFPLTLGLIPAAVLGFKALRAPRSGEDYAGVRFVLAWFIPSFLVFEAATTKLAHYPLPTYGALALLAGAGIVRWWDSGRAGLRFVSAAHFAFGALGLMAAAALLATYAPGEEAGETQRATQAALTVGAVAVIGAIVIAASRRLAWAWGAAIVVGLFGLWFVREHTLPGARGLLVSDEASNALARDGLHPRLSPGAPRPLYIVGYNEASLVFQTRTDVRLRRGDIAGSEAAAGAGALVEGRERDAFDAALAQRGLAFAPAGPAVTGHNYSNDDQVSLQPGRVVPAAALTAPAPVE